MPRKGNEARDHPSTPFLGLFASNRLRAEPLVFRRRLENFSLIFYWKVVRGSILHPIFLKFMKLSQRAGVSPLPFIHSSVPKSIPGSPTPPFWNILSSKNQDMSAPAENDSHSAAMKSWPSLVLGTSSEFKFSGNLGELRDEGTGSALHGIRVEIGGIVEMEICWSIFSS